MSSPASSPSSGGPPTAGAPDPIPDIGTAVLVVAADVPTVGAAAAAFSRDALLLGGGVDCASKSMLVPDDPLCIAERFVLDGFLQGGGEGGGGEGGREAERDRRRKKGREGGVERGTEGKREGRRFMDSRRPAITIVLYIRPSHAPVPPPRPSLPRAKPKRPRLGPYFVHDAMFTSARQSLPCR